MAPIPNSYQIYERVRKMTPEQLKREIEYHKKRAIAFAFMAVITLIALLWLGWIIFFIESGMQLDGVNIQI